MVSDSAPSRSDVKFGDAPTFNSDVGFALNLSPDKQAFTATFGGFEAIIGQNSPTPVVGRTFSFSLPLSDAAPGTEIPVFVQGFVLCEKGSDGHLVLIINDQTTVVDFPEGSNTSFLHQTKFKVASASDVRITIFLLVDRDSKSKAAAHLNVSSIDTDVTKHPP